MYEENKSSKSEGCFVSTVSGSACPVTTTPEITTSRAAPPAPVYVRLPRTIIPDLYALELKPNMYDTNPETFTFEGSVKIRMLCIVNTQNITLHADNLNITTENVSIVEEGGGLVEYSEMTTDNARQFLIFHLTRKLTANKYYTIELPFIGPLKNDLYVAGTILEPTSARKIFPCFDEPALKAKFDITLVHKKNLVALSNTERVSSESRGDDWIADKFGRTVTMSTYLLAFVFSDYQYTEKITKNNIRIRTWARPEAINQTSYGTQICADITTKLENYFNISYPLEKQDNFPVPDMVAYAMENWGLITYREQNILYDPVDSSDSDKQLVTRAVLHELAHMWFGNLVSPAWWDHIWLNEGFATYFEFKAYDFVNPEWKMQSKNYNGPMYDIKDKMDTWTKQKNYPVVMIQLDSNTAKSSWIIGNILMYGYYRVNYDENNWNQIIQQLNTDHTVIHVINRAQIINDAFNLAISGDSKMEIAVKTLEYLDKETDYLPWRTAITELSYVSNMLERSELFGEFGIYVRKKMAKVFQKTVSDNSTSTHMKSIFRTMIAETSCLFGVDMCVDKSKEMYKQWMDNPKLNPIDTTVRSAVYCTAVSHGGVDEWMFAFNQYQKANVEHEKLRLLYSLACTKQVWLLSRLMQLSLDTGYVRIHDAGSVLVALINNEIAASLVWDFVKENWKNISAIYSMHMVVPELSKKFNNEYQLKELETFIEEHQENGTEAKIFKEAKEQTKINIQWMKDHYKVLEMWLRSYVESS
ncbi:hypothetical protein KUTeg_011127 [Tegillarca granosa]|uniref:Aminopeptidase n=1 Tax=Tegillarca granosa TaxID=220873 RepID=A0ABQ9F7C5_TEGGR|nr:hypothetical protein KUTeg_011127 [Tegillarca granosa]